MLCTVTKFENGNNFIKKVLETDKVIIIDIIKDVCDFTLDLSIEVSEINQSIKKSKVDQIEEDHPLLDDALNIFNGKIIS